MIPLLPLALMGSNDAQAADVTCSAVARHWSQLAQKEGLKDVDVLQLADACERHGDIAAHQVQARCVLGSRSIHDACEWGPAWDQYGLDYRRWSLSGQAQAGTPSVGLSIDMRVDDNGNVSASVGAGGLGLVIGVDDKGTDPKTGPQAEPPREEPDFDFAGLSRAVKAESFSSNKLDLIRSASSASFTCVQVAELMGHLSMGDDKVEVVRILRRSIVDPGNAYRLNEALTFSSDKEQVQAMFR